MLFCLTLSAFFGTDVVFLYCFSYCSCVACSPVDADTYALLNSLRSKFVVARSVVVSICESHFNFCKNTFLIVFCF